MDTILHIGLAKTGTTYLQGTLKKSRAYLASCGILYPKNPDGSKFASHKILASFTMDPNRYGPDLKRLLGDSTKRTALQEAFLSNLEEERKDHQPDITLFSAEHLSSHSVSASLIREMLAKVNAGSTKCVVYFRRPGAHFLSRLQQSVKNTHKIPKFHGHIERTLAEYTDVFCDDDFIIRVFDRDDLIGGDIVTDFCAAVLPQDRIKPDELTTASFANETLSAEAITILMEFRSHFFGDLPNKKTLEVASLIDALRSIDVELEFQRPKLRAGVAEAIDYSTLTPLVLRDRFGVEIRDFDYVRLERGALLAEPDPITPLESLIEIDQSRRKEVLANLTKIDWVSGAEHRKWVERQLN